MTFYVSVVAYAVLVFLFNTGVKKKKSLKFIHKFKLLKQCFMTTFFLQLNVSEFYTYEL